MKKIISVLCLVITLCGCKQNVAPTASACESQRDSMEALYKFVLDKYDSVSIANAALNKRIEQLDSQLINLRK